MQEWMKNTEFEKWQGIEITPEIARKFDEQSEQARRKILSLPAATLEEVDIKLAALEGLISRVLDRIILVQENNLDEEVLRDTFDDVQERLIYFLKKKIELLEGKNEAERKSKTIKKQRSQRSEASIEEFMQSDEDEDETDEEQEEPEEFESRFPKREEESGEGEREEWKN